jgi:DNA-binding FrmR family transcriptional regulator
MIENTRSAERLRTGREKTPEQSADRRAICACGVGAEHENERRAVGVDPAIKSANLRRLRRIEGQVRGLQKMIDEDRYCADVLTQIASVHEALRSVGRELMRNHLRYCATEAIRSGDEGRSEEMYEELVELMYRYAR